MVTVYALKDNNEIFYIGQTTDINTRIYNHKVTAYKRRSNKEKRIWDILANDRKLSDEILEICPTIQALKREQEHIKKCIKNGIILINRRFKRPASLRKDISKLNKKEITILQMMGNDMNLAEVSKEIKISVRTIQTNVQRAKKKLGAKRIGGAIYKAYKLGFIS